MPSYLSPPPPCFWQLQQTVEHYLTEGSAVRGWIIDARADGCPDHITVRPFAREGNVGARISYDESKSGVGVYCDVFSSASSWKEWLPTLKYSTNAKNLHHIVLFALPSGKVDYSMWHSAYSIGIRSFLYDGCPSSLTFTTRVHPGVYVGAQAGYDAKRSGLKNSTFLAAITNCSAIRNGDLLTKYSLKGGLSVQLRVPLHSHVDAAVIVDRTRWIAGLQAMSPCGTRMKFNVNFKDSSCTVTTIRNMKDVWKLTFTCTTLLPRSSGSFTSPRVGLKITHEDGNDEVEDHCI